MNGNQDKSPDSELVNELSKILPPDYQLIRKLGQGGAGSVWLAYHRTLSQNVAIKVFAAAQSADRSEALHKELKAVSKLEHPSIVKVRMLGQALDSSFFIVYEYLEGRSLQALLDSGADLNGKLLACIVSQLADSLSYLHEQNLLHRDIKPSNIMIVGEQTSSYLELKLLDFGIARAIENESPGESESRTRTNTIKGSAAYMSPEQCKQQQLSPRSDLYSFAAVFYQLLLRRTLFQADSDLAMIYKQANSPPPLPDKELPEALNKALMRALSKDPEQRQASIEEFKNEILKGLLELDNPPAIEPASILKRVLAAILLLLTVLPLLIWLDQIKGGAGQDDFGKKPAHSETKALSATAELRAIKRKLAYDLRVRTSNDLTKTRKDAIKDLQDLLGRTKNKKELFSIYDTIAEGQYYINDMAAASKTLAENIRVGMEIAGENSKIPVELLKPVVKDAAINWKIGNHSKARGRVKLALEILKQEENLEKGRYIEPPEFEIDLPDLESSTYSLVAEDCIERNDFASAKSWISKAQELLTFAWNGNFFTRPCLQLCKTNLLQGNKAAALKCIDDVLAEIHSMEKSHADYNAAYYMKEATHWLIDEAKEQEKACRLASELVDYVKRNRVEGYPPGELEELKKETCAQTGSLTPDNSGKANIKTSRGLTKTD